MFDFKNKNEMFHTYNWNGLCNVSNEFLNIFLPFHRLGDKFRLKLRIQVPDNVREH